MALSKHLNEAAARLKDASTRIEIARVRPPVPENLRDWLNAVSDFCMALSDIQTFDNESVHEKLHELAERTHVKTVAPAGHRQTN